MVYLTDKKTNDKIVKLNKQKVIKQWIQDNGAASFDLKNEDIFLWDGGLFSIEKEKFMRSKVIGHKKLPNGMVEILFSKNIQ